MKFCSYDIEIYNELYDESGKELPLKDIIPSIAAYCLDDLQVKYFYDDPYMSKETAKKLVFEMMDHYKNGILPLTWNGTAFDFPLLGLYSGEIEACAELALSGVDMMLIVTFHKGYYLGLDTALKGMCIETKIHTVTMSDGSVLDSMSGQKAPMLWRNHEYEAVKTYLAGDVIQPLKLAQAIQNRGRYFWFSKTGKPQSLYTHLIPVKECFKLPLPNISWMANPPQRSDFIDWIPAEIIHKLAPSIYPEGLGGHPLGPLGTPDEEDKKIEQVAIEDYENLEKEDGIRCPQATGEPGVEGELGIE